MRHIVKVICCDMCTCENSPLCREQVESKETDWWTTRALGKGKLRVEISAEGYDNDDDDAVDADDDAERGLAEERLCNAL